MVYLDPDKIDFSTFLSEMRNPKDINSMPVFRIVEVTRDRYRCHLFECKEGPFVPHEQDGVMSLKG